MSGMSGPSGVDRWGVSVKDFQWDKPAPVWPLLQPVPSLGHLSHTSCMASKADLESTEVWSQ